jgi:hypothetical protein
MKRLFIAAVATLLMSGVVNADNYNFYLHNRANGWVISSFQTKQDGQWSKNWLRGRLSPGRNIPLIWDSQSGDCRVPFRVTWIDWGSQEFTMDWCKSNPSNIYMKDNGFTWD